MGWHAHLALSYRRDGERSIVHDRHRGPLRVLKPLHPEGPGVCHSVLVHPPGGIVGGDLVEVEIDVERGAHALLTTPGATRFYRSAGEPARQSLQARVGDGARLEWLPLETLCHRGALADNLMRFALAPGAEMIGWDVIALGLPASGDTFDVGRYTTSVELPGVWRERGVIDGRDTRLLDSPLGLAGHRVLATLWFAAGQALANPRREELLDAARALIADDPLASRAGATAPQPSVLVVRALAHRVEPAMQLLTGIWSRWRTTAWQLAPCPPRVWRT